MATKNNRRTVITKRAFKEALLELMSTKSISRITIKEICDLAEMSRSTFYLHYHDQFELLEDIEEEVLKNIFDYFKIFGNELESIDSIEIFCKYVKNNSSTFAVLLSHAEDHSFPETFIEHGQQYMMSFFPQKETSEEEAMLYSFILHGSLNIVIDWINSDFKLPTRNVASIIYHACDSIMKLKSTQEN